jgi:hypothetical protein
MSDTFVTEFDDRSGRLYLHFEVRDHFLKLETFIRTADSARRIVASIDESFFSGKLGYELIVLPPAEGTFLSKLAIWVSSGTAAVFAFLNTDVGSAYVEGLTGKSSAEWAEELGKEHRDIISDAVGEAPPKAISVDHDDEFLDWLDSLPLGGEEACTVLNRAGFAGG